MKFEETLQRAKDAFARSLQAGQPHLLRAGTGPVLFSAPHSVPQTRQGRTKCAEPQTAVLAEQERIDRLAWLLSRSTSPYTTRRLKNSAIKAWAKAMGISAEELSNSDRMFFEFLASGLFGALAYHAEHPSEASYEELVHALMPVIPAAVMAHFARTGRKAPDCPANEAPAPAAEQPGSSA